MRWRDERDHEPCPHCGRNACSWHRPGRVCVYRYTDQPGEVPRYVGVVTLRQQKEAAHGAPARQ